MKYLQENKTLGVAAAKSGMDEKTARKYRDLSKLPSELEAEQIRTWRTRENPFEEVWERVKSFLENNSGFEAKTLFEYLQREYPGRFSDGQIRTFQRRVKNWRATEGPAREVFFPQVHKPGKLSQSDFTHMGKLGITIGGVLFDHLIYHFVLTYSNWETGTICFSESFESLSDGLQKALWKLGGVPEAHQTDRLSTAVNKPENPEEFTQRYQGLLSHYRLTGRKTQPASPNENGDVEQRHHRFKRALDQALMLCGSRDFATRKAYEIFLEGLFAQLNSNRHDRFKEELALLRSLPAKQLSASTKLTVGVGPSSTIRVKHNVYSVHSRLIREKVTVRLYAERLEIWHGQSHIENIPRLRGSGNHHIQYRHIIDWLVRKPGAFENYRYRSDLFPTSRFRMAYDELKQHHAVKASKEYLLILKLAAKENEAAVDEALRLLFDRNRPISAESVESLVLSGQKPAPATDVTIQAVVLHAYDCLLGGAEVTA
ncbi:MAG: IS21 family transposase [Candidatus Aegiribacteria sp.]|nr:IS21 family transposase [Candidatus Aegiribacteria sp.]